MPSSTLVAAAAAAPPLRRRRPFESVTLPLPVFHSLPSPRDWAAGLPPELLSCILHRLDHVQIMLGADKVCRSWRRAARDEPELWRRIDMRGYAALSDRNLVDLNQMAVEAVRRSQGQCRAFAGEGDGLRDEFIHYLANHAPLLKRLVLVACHQVLGQGFMEAIINGFPLLEELHLCMCWRVQRAAVLEVFAKECPHLKHLIICNACSILDHISDKEAMAIAKMQELRSLQLAHNDLSIQGLEAIIDNCLHLKSLDILNCYNIRMTPDMEARIKAKKLLMNYSSDGRWDNFDEPDSPAMSECSTCLNYFGPVEMYRECYPYNCFGPNTNQQLYPTDEKEAILISAVRELRLLELYCGDLTSKGLTAILDKCPHLEPLDVWNCLNITRNNNPLLRARWHRPIKTKKLTTKLLMDCSNHNVFNPAGLDMRNCRNIVMNSCHGRRVMMDNTLPAKYKRLILRKWAKEHHKRTKKMKASIEQYLAEYPGRNVDYMEFKGVEFGSYRYDTIFNPNNCRFELGDQYIYNCLYWDWESDDVEFEHGSGLDRHDETEFQVHDRMLGKRFRRYLEMQ